MLPKPLLAMESQHRPWLLRSGQHTLPSFQPTQTIPPMSSPPTQGHTWIVAAGQLARVQQPPSLLPEATRVTRRLVAASPTGLWSLRLRTLVLECRFSVTRPAHCSQCTFIAEVLDSCLLSHCLRSQRMGLKCKSGPHSCKRTLLTRPVVPVLLRVVGRIRSQRTEK